MNMGNSRNRTNDASGPYVLKSGESGRKKHKRGPGRCKPSKYASLSLDERVLSRVAAQMPIKGIEKHELKEALVNVHPSKYQRAWKKHTKSLNVETEDSKKVTHCDRCNGFNLEEQDHRGKWIVQRADIVQLPGGPRCTKCGRWWV